MNIQTLFNIIENRKQNPSETSYTKKLFNEGLQKITQKVGEESTEVIIAALSQNDERLIEEIADLTYHMLVLLSARGLTPKHIFNELEKRHK
ncbi:MAG: phosphoribosyl-ATP diphosphatase [Anaerolineales bacterium]